MAASLREPVFAGFEPLCLSPSEDLETLFPPNSPIGSARRQHCCSVFVSSLAPHVAAPAAQLSRSRATMAGSGASSVWRNAADLIKWLEDAIPVWMQHSQILLITEPEMLISLSYKLLPHHQGWREDASHACKVTYTRTAISNWECFPPGRSRVESCLLGSSAGSHGASFNQTSAQTANMVALLMLKLQSLLSVFIMSLLLLLV